MLTLLTGAPGAGKSAAAVDLLIAIAATGRKCYVSGVPNLDVDHVALTDDEVLRWHEPGVVEDGSLIFVDEVQRIWRAGAGSGAKIPASVAALETHRHRGLDFILVTQGPGLLHSNIRALVGRHIHLRDVGILGRWWYEWPEATSVDRFRSAPVKKRYRLPKQVFSRYKSASLHIKPVRSLPPALFIFLIAGTVGLVAAFMAWRSIAEKTAPGRFAGTAGGASAPAGGARPLGGPPGGPSGPPRPVAHPDDIYSGLGLHITGYVGTDVYLSLTLPGGRVMAYVSPRELVAAGYALQRDGHCTALVTRGASSRRIFCDQPAGLPATAGAGAPGAPVQVQVGAPGAPGPAAMPRPAGVGA